MAESDSACCGPTPCCGGGPREEYEYPEPHFLDGTVDAFMASVPRVTTALTAEDRRGALRVRLNVGRSDYRVTPGLYAIGEPDDTAPVLVTANYKLTFDTVRAALAGRNVWILVLDSRGVNVWCAAGKGTFGTEELITQIRDAHLEQIVSHTQLIVPQLGATGVAAHAVRAATGFRVKWGPVDIHDVPEYLDNEMTATESMRRVPFPMKDRATLIPVEFSAIWRPRVLLGIAIAIAVAALFGGLLTDGIASAGAAMLLAALAAVVGGTVIVPLLLPWIPGRAFALKGGIIGALTGALVAFGWYDVLGVFGALAVVSVSIAIASFTAMNFTGSSTYTSPSGVEWEMRRAIPVQIAALAGGAVLTIAAIAV